MGIYLGYHEKVLVYRPRSARTTQLTPLYRLTRTPSFLGYTI